MKEYKEKLLKDLGIYELRELARSVGVIAPTTKKRKDLEREIVGISKGEIVPEVKKSKKGRPPKSIKKLENVVDVFMPKKIWEINLNKKMDLQAENLSFNSSEAYEDEHLIEGFLRKTLAGHYYIRNRSNLVEFALIPYNYVSEFGLVEGDKLSIIAKRLTNDEQLIFKDLIKVNKNAPSLESRNLGSLEDIVFAQNSIKGFEGVFEGENVLLLTENIKSDVAVIKDAIRPLLDGYEVVILASGVSTYTKLLLEKDFDAELIHTVSESHPALAYENVLNAFNHVDLLLKQGKQVVFVALDIITLVKQMEDFFVLEHKKQTAEENIEAVRILKRIFDYGKVLKNSGSVTVFAHCLKDEVDQELFKKELSKLPDKVFYL